MKRFLYNVGYYLLLLMVVIPTVYTAGPWLETKYWPVFSKFTIASAVEVSPGVTRVVVSFDKRRECAPGGFGWFSGKRGEPFEELTIVATVQDSGSGSGRPVGRQLSKPFDINIADDQIADNVFVDIFSRCHPLWVTRSEVYP